MMRSESFPMDSNSSRAHLIVNTSALRAEDFNTFLALNEEIERHRSEKLAQAEGNLSVKVVKTNEETFDGSVNGNQYSIDNDMFLTALEHQNSYVPQITDLDETLENAMKYFDEDVQVSTTADSTPKKPKLANSRVAAVIDQFHSKSQNITSPENQVETKYHPEIRANIKQLRQKYESFEEPKMGLSSTPKSPKVTDLAKSSKKSKVRQMAQLFNSKISSIMKKELEVGHYEKLQNEFSPEPKPVVETKVQKVPLAKQRTKLPTYRTGLPSPVPSPRLKRKQLSKPINSNNTTCLVAEDVFSQLSVKDKALLYNQFIADMSKKNPKFNKHAQLIEEKVKKQFARGEVVNEKQASVKELKEELEAKCSFPKQTISPTATETIKSVKKPESRSKSVGSTPLKRQDKDENEDFHCTMASSFFEHDLNEEENEIHVSTLTVVLKPSPIRPKTNAKTTARRRKEVRRGSSSFVVEPCAKRTNMAMHTSLPIEVYAPPKKIRRTRFEHLAPKMFFQNNCLERLFYSWLKERNGVSFNITPIANTEHTIDIAVEEELVHDTLEETHKSAVDRLLEEAIAKLEHVEKEILNKESRHIEEKEIDTSDKKLKAQSLKQEASKEEEEQQQKVQITKQELKAIGTPLRSSRKHKKAPAPPIPAPRHSVYSSSCVSSVKNSEAEDSESGLSTIPKITTDESQPEQQEKERETSEHSQENENEKPLKPPRKKKIRRNLAWKKENSIINPNPMTTTDSDSDYKSLNPPKKASPPLKTQNKIKASSYVKRLLFKAKPSGLNAVPKTPVNPSESSFVGLDKSLMKTLNSPRKIKSAYTLTVISSPHTETDYCYDSENGNRRRSSKEISHSWPSLIDVIEKESSEVALQSQYAMTPKEKSRLLRLQEPRHLIDSFIDQGFETGSNEIESPSTKQSQSRRNSLNEKPKSNSISYAKEEPKTKASELLSESNPSGFSTPVKGHCQQTFSHNSGSHETHLSPITTPMKSARRKSLYENDSRRSSFAMQVIKEDHALDTGSMPMSPISNYSGSENAFFANAPTLDMSSTMPEFNTTKDTSTLWISTGDFTIATEIFYNSSERIRCLYNIFSQKTCESVQINFGIDNHKFCYQNHIVSDEEIVQRLPKLRDASHYWFQTSDLVIPFSGKLMPESRVKRLFKFISESLADNDQIHIGVDDFEFCVFELNDDNEPEFVSNQPKFSIESSYSMLIGLQSGHSNGLEGRSKFAWPSSMSSSSHSNNARTSDLGQSGCESEEFDTDMGRLSFSPFGVDDLNMRRISESGLSAELFSLEFDNEPLDQLFKDTLTLKDNSMDMKNMHPKLNPSKMDSLLQKTQATVNNAIKHLKEIIPEVENEYQYIKNYNKMNANQMSLDEMLATLKNQQEKLKIVLDTLHSYSQSSKTNKKFMEQIQNSPEYETKLQQIVKSIEEIGHDNGFHQCSKEQLESFMYFLSHYAELILSPFSEHMNKILDTLLDRRSIEV